MTKKPSNALTKSPPGELSMAQDPSTVEITPSPVGKLSGGPRAPKGNANAARTLDAIADEIRDLERCNYFDIGKHLLEAKDVCDHGQWEEWLGENFDWSQDTAENYMKAARLADKFRTVRNLNVPASVIYKLAGELEAADLPEIIDALIKKASNGKKYLTVDDAEEVIELTRPRPKPRPRPRPKKPKPAPAKLVATVAVEHVPTVEPAFNHITLSPAAKEAMAAIHDTMPKHGGGRPPRNQIAVAWLSANLSERVAFVEEFWDDLRSIHSAPEKFAGEAALIETIAADAGIEMDAKAGANGNGSDPEESADKMKKALDKLDTDKPSH
jgi:hypothetical protein